MRKTAIPRISAVFILLLCSVFSGFASVVFSGLDLSENNELLFYADSDGNGAYPQGALFSASLGTLETRQLSAFPEKIDLIENGRTIQIRNSFGTVRVPVTGGLPRSIPGFPSFADGAPVLGGRVESMAPSRDGRWVLYIEPVSPAYGNLVMVDALSGARTVISENIERPGSYFPACWSPDSRVFVYNRGDTLYYYAINTAAGTVDERYRIIGKGTVKSVYWGFSGDFFYLRGSTVYRVRSSDLFARTMYADFLEIGSIAGKIPFEFDQNFDQFWVSPDSRSMLLAKGGRNLFYYPLGIDDYSAAGESSLPYVFIPRSGSDITVLWSASGLVTVIVSSPRREGAATSAYRLNTISESSARIFSPLEIPMGSGAALSPDGTKALLWGAEGMVLYDYINWKQISSLRTVPVYAGIWTGNDEIIVGDAQKIERLRLSGQGNLICLSSAQRYGFEEKTSRIMALSGNSWYATDGTSPWRQVASPVLRNQSQVSGQYRVYLERQASGPYANIPMIRNIVSVGTFPLLPSGENLFEAIPDVSDTMDTAVAGVFAHGKRTGLREVALCFDLMDDSEGLPLILNTLSQFNIRATFFLNGEFIRRHPDAAREISDAGHECASMFFAPIDLSDARYRINREFITRGLARNEDEFFKAASAELSLLWHAPYYAASAEIVTAAASAGYRTIGRDVDPMDWILREDAKRIGISQFGASAMVDRIMAQKKPGSIIPVRLGLLPGGRDDYLFSRIDVLLDALIRAGYSVVPVSTLIEHSR
ncbi:polysaccharide deacetylase family protein [Breznakiella homolactica]|uniref:Polysaccharide deacetylase family protein n=1 Tax=Breznakiella homolactica TaxID=2798577 RepID=A0A7T7XL58_9SPIR|nr:polysaccharide deacetylase family protein [Breznakiella homolactica]QQO08320.1 polysaccharide deacetylase family protein [Breznakiella homolactica]